MAPVRRFQLPLRRRQPANRRDRSEQNQLPSPCDHPVPAFERFHASNDPGGREGSYYYHAKSNVATVANATTATVAASV